MADERTIASIALREYADVDPRLMAELVLRLGPPEDLWQNPALAELSDELISAELRDQIAHIGERFPEIESRIALLLDREISVQTFFSNAYPSALRSIADPPPYLYVRGMSPGDRKCICVTGRHDPTADSIADAVTAGRELQRAGFSVVSGLAPGIETAVHVGLLSNEGASFAFCGFGLDAELPADVQAVADQIARFGGLCTEYPETVEPLHELREESVRLLIGVCAGVLIVDAEEESSISSAFLDAAQEESKPVFFLSSSGDAALDRLLSAGAYPLSDASKLEFITKSV
jgi:DNA processing protein